ncbi:MAG: cysteine--tRNA ligase [Acidiferrobacteraceae bacterium]
MIRIHNTASRRKEPLVPIEPGHVRLYVCGMTVYDLCHLGHARVMVVFDAAVRYLRSRLRVTYVRNITDIDDKIIARAHELGEPIDVLTQRYIDAMHEDERALGVMAPDHEPRATAHVAAIIRMIETLIAKGYGYAAKGDVYYRVRAFPRYGALSGKSIDDLRAGARVQSGEGKDDPLDFALWKAAKPGEPSWASPWGPGRPGWHIECSAMSIDCLGPHFDIHGGGPDLRFPHHENEIAQSEAATGEHFANLWMHNGPVDVDGQKMAKSSGNFLTIRDALTRHQPETLRYFLLQSHYRSPIDYSEDAIGAARASLARLYAALEGVDAKAGTAGGDYERRFVEAMDDDFNTPVALSVLFELTHDLQRWGKDSPQAAELAFRLRRLGGLLGLLQQPPSAFLQWGRSETGLTPPEIEHLIAERNVARQERRWTDSDRIREELGRRGVILEDVSGGGTRWRRQ